MRNGAGVAPAVVRASCPCRFTANSMRSLLPACRMPTTDCRLPLCRLPICPLPQCTGAVGAARSRIFFMRNMNGIMARKVMPSSQNVSV